MQSDKILGLFTLSIFLVLAMPFWFQDGMFLDGLVYSSISRNLAEGLGSPFTLHYTQTIHPEFFEHPPLMFWLLSLLFKIFGDSILVERLFNCILTCFIIHGIIINWRNLSGSKYKPFSFWLPVLLWTITPIVFWSFRTTLLDNLICVFALYAVYFLSKASQQFSIYSIILGSLFVVLAFFTKGPVGLFPCCVPFVYYIINRKKITPAVLTQMLVLLSISLAIYLLINFIPGAKENFSQYLERQLKPALNNKREVTVNSHFGILIKLASELIVPIALILLAGLFSRFKNFSVSNKQQGLFFLLIAVSASLPLMITLKQHRFYLLPSLPFYILALSHFFGPIIFKLTDALSVNIIKKLKFASLLGILLTLAFSIYKIKQPSRDHAVIQDVKVISQFIPAGTIISCSSELYKYYELHGYLARIGKISMDGWKERPYLLIEKGNKLDKPSYNLIDLPLQRYSLYQVQK